MFDNSDDYEVIQKYIPLKNLPAFALFRLNKSKRAEEFISSYVLQFLLRKFHQWEKYFWNGQPRAWGSAWRRKKETIYRKKKQSKKRWSWKRWRGKKKKNWLKQILKNKLNILHIEISEKNRINSMLSWKKHLPKERLCLSTEERT